MARFPKTERTVESPTPGFSVTLDNFEGPFDLLLSLIAKHEVDITDIALSKVTDEFLHYLKGCDSVVELDRASEFLAIAATLLDVKIAELLPQGELVDAEDVAIFEARDLLFARLLQYRAFKEVSAWFAERIEEETARNFRAVPLEEKFREHTPELSWSLSSDDFAAIAAAALAPAETAVLTFSHVYAPLVSIREQAAHIVTLLRSGAPVTFARLISGITERGVVVARFLAVLELYRHAAIICEQNEPLGAVSIRWVAENWTDHAIANLGADYDR